MAIVFPGLSPEEEGDAVVRTQQSESEKPRTSGDRVFIVGATWFDQWCRHTRLRFDHAQGKLVRVEDESSPDPGPIDNSDILDGDADAGDLTAEELAATAPLKPGLQPKTHYWTLHEPTYKLLKDRHKTTGLEVQRQYIATGPRKRPEVHVDQWHLKVVDDHSGRSMVLPALCMASAEALKEAACGALGLQESEYVIMSYPGETGTPISLEGNIKKTLLGLGLRNRQTVLLRRRDHPTEAAAAQESRQQAILGAVTPALGPQPIATPAVAMSIDTSHNPAPLLLHGPPLGSPKLGSLSPGQRFATSPGLISSSPLSRSFGRAPVWAEDTASEAPGRRPGLAGLANLGNTCFMNSSLQCLSHTVPLLQTFLSGSYTTDLNRDNPLGLGGKLASAFGSLMQKLWRGGVGAVSPKHFKWQLGKFAPQFGGYAQQDSQELLAFLLDGLHEDLNRIVVKPYREEKDSDGRPDAEVAAEAWDNYRARNDSVIVDHFQGLYKSTLRCPRCNQESVKFDPFMYLSLPLPTPKTKTFIITAVDVSGSSAPLVVAPEVPKTATIETLLQAVAALCGDPNAATEGVGERWLLAQWAPSAAAEKFQLFADGQASVSSIQERRGSSFFSSSRPSQLIAYFYPDATRSPASGTRPVIVFHRLKMAQIAPPSVIFPPGDAPDTPLQLEQYKGTTGGWRLSHAPLLESALDAMLTPFVKPMDGNAAPGPGDDAASEPDVEVGPVEKKLREDKENEGGMPLANGIAPVGSGNGIGEDDDMPALVPAAPAGLGADDAMHSGEAADTDQDMPSIDLNDLVQPDTPVHSVDGTPSTSAEGAPTEEDVGMEGESAKELARGGLGAEPSATDLADMASAPDGDGADAMAVDGATQPSGTSAVQDAAPAKRYTLALGMPGGQVKFSYGTTPPEVGGLRGDAPLYLCADWQAAALEGLDRAAWESPREHESAVTARSPATLRPREVTLHDCVEAFCQREQLDASDSWYCSKCKDHVQAEKKLDLWRLPEVLVVHLKRFSYSRYSRDKLDTEVAFPLEELDLRAFVPATEGGTLPVEGTGVTGGAVPPAPVYDLFAVSNHFGGLGGGHYTAFCRMPDDGRWYTFDDSSVHEMDPGSVRSSAAYVLFYRRRGAADPDVAKVIAEAANASAIDVFGDSGRRGSGLVLEQVGEALEEEESGAVDVKVEMDEGEGAGDGERGTSLTAHKLPLDTEDADADDDDDMILGKIA